MSYYEVSDEGETVLVSELTEVQRAKALFPALIKRLVAMRESGTATVFDAAKEAKASGVFDLRTRVAVMSAAGWDEWNPRDRGNVS